MKTEQVSAESVAENVKTAADFPIAIYWPDYTYEQQCYIRQDIADELYEVLEHLKQRIAAGQYCGAPELSLIKRALAKAGGGE